MKVKKKLNGKRKKSDALEQPLLSRETKNSIVATILFLLAILLALSLLDKAGIMGVWLKAGMQYLFGVTAFLLPTCLLLGGLALIVRLKRSHGTPVLVGMILIMASLLGIVALAGSTPYQAGVVGYGVAFPALSFLSSAAGIVLFAALLIIGMFVMFDISFASIGALFSLGSLTEEPPETGEDLEPSEWSLTPLEKLNRIKNSALAMSGISEEKEAEKETSSEHTDSEYEPPPLSLLEPDGAGPSSGDIQANKNIIQRTLQEFGIDVEMAEVSVGPTVTQYTLKPAQGVNVTRITALSKNLSLALAAHPIRIEAPIPGKALVGVEIPNKQASMVRLRSLLSGIANKKLASSLVLALGRDVGGEATVAFLDKMPHLLISGSTGSGKSIGLNAIIVSLIYFNSPRNLRFLLIDPKRVEFAAYEGIPHLIAPVVVDTRKAISALKWAIAEMERRYEMLEQVNARDIKGYNDVMKRKSQGKPLPYLVIIIDEMADLMMKFKREVEASIVRIAQMARAVGIHMITSTQRPSTNVVTGLIKANIITRIAFKMPTQIDSRTILDQGGAEKLLGHGDMLFMSGEAQGLKRIQGTYISDKELKNVVGYLRNLGWEDDYAKIDGAAEEKNSLFGADGGGDVDNEDSLYEEAKAIARQAGKVSATLLQRKLQVGYSRAARMLDMMEEEGIIGPTQGAKPREVIKP